MTLKRSFVGVFSLLTEKIQLSLLQGSHKPRQAQAKGRRKHKSRQSRPAAIQLYEKNCPVSAPSLVSDNFSLIYHVHMNEISYIFFGVSQFGKRSFILFAIFKKDIYIPALRTPGRMRQAFHHARVRVSTRINVPTCNDWHAFCGPANVQVLSLARILRPSRSVSISHSSGTPAATQACLSRLIRRPVRLWLRFRSDRRYPQRAAFPWIPCL